MKKSAVSFCALALVLSPLGQGSIIPSTLEATLYPGESVAEHKCVTIPDLPPRVDVILAFDLTGSMGGVIDTAKANAIAVMTQLEATGTDFQFAVVSYMDYPSYYESCGYNTWYGSAGCGDYAYRLDQALTDDTAAVSNAINDLVLGCGDDGPQDYTRIFYESFADPSVSWRPGAKRILLNFGDNVPHDCNLNEGWAGGVWSTGGDPGRDEVMGTADDLDLQAVLAGMAAANVSLLEAHTGGDWTGGLWSYWTGLTGGQVFDTTAGEFVTLVTEKILSAATVPVVNGLTIAAGAGYEPWLTSVAPPAYDGVLPGEERCFEIQITVPDGTAEGDYVFTISALDKGFVSYGDQTVTIHVIVNQPPDCSGAYPSIARLWPPNNKFVPVQVLGVTDPDGDPVTITIDAIRQDEPVNTYGDGNFAPDGTGVGSSTAQVRAERSGTAKVPGNGRMYHIYFTADDGRGLTCSGEVLVGVPHDVKDAVIDGGPIYDSTLTP